jgi:murein DD-endopeptidase MepM/ murein hydrolase activator NlpD
LLVKVGDHVHRGDIIAKAGSTGRSTGSHVHYEVWLNHQLTDPSHFLFEVPSEPAAQTVVLNDNQPLGLAVGMGGDDDDAEATFNARMAVPTTSERLPVNLGITVGFFILALIMVGSLVPAMRHEPDDGLGF